MFCRPECSYRKSERYDGSREVPFPIDHERLSDTVYGKNEYELEALLGNLIEDAGSHNGVSANPFLEEIYRQEFIDYVMSDEGDAFIERFIDESDSWSNAIKQWKKRKGFICFLPDNAVEIELKDF